MSAQNVACVLVFSSVQATSLIGCLEQFFSVMSGVFLFDISFTLVLIVEHVELAELEALQLSM